MKWIKDYVLHANWKTPWGLYFEARKTGKQLQTLPGYTEIWHEQKRLLMPFYVYLGLFIIIYFFFVVFAVPSYSVTEFCYSGNIKVECPEWADEPKDGLCEAGKILTNKGDDWWCVDPEAEIQEERGEHKQLGILIDDGGCEFVEYSGGKLYSC